LEGKSSVDEDRLDIFVLALFSMVLNFPMAITNLKSSVVVEATGNLILAQINSSVDSLRKITGTCLGAVNA
jgi:hypothetical protein